MHLSDDVSSDGKHRILYFSCLHCLFLHSSHPRWDVLCLWRHSAVQMLWGPIGWSLVWPGYLRHSHTQRQLRFSFKTLASVSLPFQVVLNLVCGQVSMQSKLEYKNGLQTCKCLRNQVSFLWWHECLRQIRVWMQSSWCSWWKRCDSSATDCFSRILPYPQLCLTTNRDIFLSNAVTIKMSPLR